MQERGFKLASMANRYRSLRVFWNWLVSEDEIQHSLVEKMPAPAVPEIPVPVITIGRDRTLACGR